MIPVFWDIYLLSTGKLAPTFQQHTTPPSSGSKRPRTSQFDCVHHEVIAKLFQFTTVYLIAVSSITLTQTKTNRIHCF